MVYPFVNPAYSVIQPASEQRGPENQGATVHVNAQKTYYIWVGILVDHNQQYLDYWGKGFQCCKTVFTPLLKERQEILHLVAVDTCAHHW